MESECCGGRMIGGIQCETCGSDGKLTRIKPITWSSLQKEKRIKKIKEEALSVIYITIAIVFVIVVGISVGI